MDTLLQSKFTDSDGIDHPYFEHLEPNQADQLQFNHLDVLKTAVKKAQDDLIISSEVADWLVPDEYAPGRLYGLVKDHFAPEKWPKG